jgi:hypothetical protein
MKVMYVPTTDIVDISFLKKDFTFESDGRTFSIEDEELYNFCSANGYFLRFLRFEPIYRYTLPLPSTEYPVALALSKKYSCPVPFSQLGNFILLVHPDGWFSVK